MNLFTEYRWLRHAGINPARALLITILSERQDEE